MSFLNDIKAIPITDIADKLGLTLVRKGQYYSLKEYDSTMIDPRKNCFWRNSRFSQGFKGGAGSSIDFVMEFGGEPDCRKSMRRLALMYGMEEKTENRHEVPVVKISECREKCRGLCLPRKDKDNLRVCHYLLGRGVSQKVINFFLDRNMLYQDVRKNCVFVSQAGDFACVRGTDTCNRYISDCRGSNYQSCFFFKGRTDVDRLVMSESVIDLMSIMTYMYVHDIDYCNYAYLATSGTNKVQSLAYHVQKDAVNKIYLCNDNDRAGREADRKAMQILGDMGFGGSCKIVKSPEGKDWNEYVDIINRKKGYKE